MGDLHGPGPVLPYSTKKQWAMGNLILVHAHRTDTVHWLSETMHTGLWHGPLTVRSHAHRTMTWSTDCQKPCTQDYDMVHWLSETMHTGLWHGPLTVRNHAHRTMTWSTDCQKPCTQDYDMVHCQKPCTQDYDTVHWLSEAYNYDVINFFLSTGSWLQDLTPPDACGAVFFHLQWHAHRCKTTSISA